MRSGDIRIADGASWGIKTLKSYLEYAETGKLEQGILTDREPDSEFEIFVRDRLVQHGFEVVPQVGVAGYEYIWSVFWWFDDVQLVNASYNTFEAMALQTDHASNLEFLCNVLQLLVNAIVHGHLSREASKLDERTAALRQALEVVAANKERPNNSLEAETLLLILRHNSALFDNKLDDLPQIWRGYSVILERAAGLGEFKAERLVSMIEVVGDVAGNDAAYNELIEKVADFVAKRSSEAEGALIL